MPLTATTFLIGWLTISGIPPLSAFWSKDDILAVAWHKSPALWAVGFVTAGLTAYYMTRQIALVWFGQARWEESAGQAAAEEAAHGSHAGPHESPWTMAVPLVVLGALSVVGGVINLPFGKWDFLARWLAPVVPADPHVDTGVKVALAVAAVAVAVVGIVVAWIPWSRKAEHPELEPAVLEHGWYYDDAVSAFVGGPGTEFAEFQADDVDAGVIDGAVNGVAALTRSGGSLLRKLQTGYVRNYALGVAAGAAVLLFYVAVRGVQ
jgi:NADH-quinone oxidoreductase subunit L